MVGRSLFSLLALAAVAFQSCQADNVLSNGSYTLQIGLSDILGVSRLEVGAPAVVRPVKDPYKYTQWEVLNTDAKRSVVIRSRDAQDLYLAPRTPATKDRGFPIVLSNEVFEWSLDRLIAGVVVVRRKDAKNLVMGKVPGATVRPAETQWFREFDENQEWRFKPVLEPSVHCGPWRLDRESLYLQ
ncbi:hypothetical protein B0O80DRAFT_429127 [Mortierella sp. GBAus27b]|nr:hypothetical protein B0O80DRAFT_429127 [Mortierella sp. GBAus27b]